MTIPLRQPLPRARILCAGLAASLALLATSSALGATASFSGTATAGNPPQPFSVTVSSPGQIDATLQWADSSARLTLSILDPNGTQVAIDTTANDPKTLHYTATLTGVYKVRVKAKTGSSSFGLTVGYPGVAVPSYAGQVGGGSLGHATTYAGGVAVGPDGTVYVSDTGNDQVEAFSASGSELWTTNGQRGSKAVGSFNNPRDIAYLNGSLYVDDTGNNRVQVLDAATHAATAWTTKFPSTLGISAGKDSAGHNIILVSEDTSNQIAVFTPSGSPICSMSVPSVSGVQPLPRDAATDPAGNIYVAAYQNDQIDVFGPVVGSTCPTTQKNHWGSHGSGNDQFLRPYGVDTDSSGNVYVADSVNDRVQEFTSSGTYLATYGAAAPPNGTGDLHFLRRVAVAGGQVYAADLWGFHVDRFSAPGDTPAQTYPTTVTGPQDGYFNEPSGLAFDSSGTMYVADSVNQRIQPFAPGADGVTWTAQPSWGARGWGKSDLSGFNWPRDITYAPSTNTLWVADTKNDRLLQFATDGTSSQVSIGSKLTMNWPYGVQADGTRVVAADTYANRVESWNADGSSNWQDSSANGTPFNHPYDAAVANGIVYVADSGNKRIVELNASTGAYAGTISGPQLHSPYGVAVDPVSGSVWVSDTSYNRVVEFSSTGAYIQAFGKAGSAAGQFNRPTHLDVHVDAGGTAHLYVVDTYNDRVQILDLNEN